MRRSYFRFYNSLYGHMVEKGIERRRQRTSPLLWYSIEVCVYVFVYAIFAWNTPYNKNKSHTSRGILVHSPFYADLSKCLSVRLYLATSFLQLLLSWCATVLLVSLLAFSFPYKWSFHKRSSIVENFSDDFAHFVLLTHSTFPSTWIGIILLVILHQEYRDCEHTSEL